MLGEVLEGRFVLEAPIGAGGMGTVFRALDRQTGRPVAVKLARADAQRDDARFAAEIALLEELSHPGIVAFVAHGNAADGRPFLAMELLEGEDLGQRLARGALTLAESVAVLRGVAEALAIPHARGIVHRDLKPSNLFLRGGSLERLVLLDFGIARGHAAQPRTATGLMVGTPEYMAPEQAKGERELDPSADVFALGCVLYECLAGRSPFASEHLAATLAKVLFEEPRPLEAIRRDLWPPLARLVRRMLAKDRALRPRDAAALLAELDALGELADPKVLESSLASPSSGIGREELELVTVILATPEAGEPSADTLEAGPTSFGEQAMAIARAHLRSPELVIEALGDGSVLIALGQQGESPVDQALLSVTCAIALRSALSHARVTVTSARRRAGERRMLGDALERAGRLLPRVSGAQRGVLLDEVTAELLHGRVRVERLEHGAALVLEELPLDASRPLLGKPTPCVGREHELASLEGLAFTAFDDGVVRAALVSAPAGVGKSRLRHELLRRLQARAHPTVLSARGELLRAGSPHALIGSALRRRYGSTAELLEEGVRRDAPELLRLGDDVVAFLGELCDAPFADEGRTVLRAARQDPRLMQAKLAEAFVAFVTALAVAGPVVLEVEDLHWGDRPSIDLLGRLLREELPVFVVAFARPEAKETFGEIWAGKALELPLLPLGRRACQKLVERVAGDRLGATAIARVVEQAAGNALWLEELVRAAAEGRQGSPAGLEGELPELPETVLAMVQARIGRLDPEARRLLRAASVLGETFRRDALAALLPDHEAFDSALAELGRREILEPISDQLRFRHSLVRDAAYGLLTDADRRLGHRLAAAWLETREPDPLPIAEHHLRAEDPERAAPWLLRAVERAFERDEFETVIRLSRRSEALPEGIAAELASYRSGAQLMRWDWPAAEASAREAVERLSPGGRAWVRAQRVAGTLAAYRNHPQQLRDRSEALLSVTPSADVQLEYGDTLLHLASAAAQTGDTRLARGLYDRAREGLAPLLSRYPGVHAWQHQIRCTLLRHTDDDLATQLILLTEAERQQELIGAPRSMRVLLRDVLGEALARAGQLPAALAVLRRAYEDAVRLGASYVLSHARLALAHGLLAGGDVREAGDAGGAGGVGEADLLGEADALVREVLAMPGISDGYRAMAGDALSEVLLLRGDHAEAARQARLAIALSSHTPVRRWLMVAHLGEALLALGEPERAFAETSAALAEVDAAEGGGYAETPLLLSSAAAAWTSGRAAIGADLLRRVHRRVGAQAAGFLDPTAFAAFVERSPGAVRLRALQARWPS